MIHAPLAGTPCALSSTSRCHKSTSIVPSPSVCICFKSDNVIIILLYYGSTFPYLNGQLTLLLSLGSQVSVGFSYSRNGDDEHMVHDYYQSLSCTLEYQ